MKSVYNMSQKRKRIIINVLFLSPILVLFIGVLVNSICQTVYLSFFDWNGIPGVPLVFKGFENYIEVFKDNNFWNSMKVVAVFIMQGTFIQLPLSLLFAIIVSKGIRLSSMYKTVFFIPSILPLSAVGLMWFFVLNPNGGLLTTAIQEIGFKAFNINFLGDPAYAVYSVAMVSAWVYIGYNMVIFAAGITKIPHTLYEAGKIDGANGFRLEWHITMPLLKETFKVYVVMMITGSLKTFDLIYAMTRGGPNRVTEGPAIMMYNEVFGYNDYGKGNVIATIILVLGLVCSILINKMFTEKEWRK